ncbi:MAG: hypothetical protein ABW123_10685, partial [Cystobacter sp.]
MLYDIKRSSSRATQGYQGSYPSSSRPAYSQPAQYGYGQPAQYGYGQPAHHSAPSHHGRSSHYDQGGYHDRPVSYEHLAPSHPTRHARSPYGQAPSSPIYGSSRPAEVAPQIPSVDCGLPGRLGHEVSTLASKSAAMTVAIGLAKALGWETDIDRGGRGSRADRSRQEIHVDCSSGKPKRIASELAHELGHVMGDLNYTPPHGLTRSEFINTNLDECLRDEARAVIFNAEVRQEILDNGGPDIHVNGALSSYYESIPARYDLSSPSGKDRAIAEVAQQFGANEKTLEGGRLMSYQDYHLGRLHQI